MNSLRRGVWGHSLFSRIFQEKTSSASVRYLYNEQFLGMDKFIEGRERTLGRMGSMKDNFFYRMQQQVKSASPSMIFTEDLKTVIHSCDDKTEEIELCVNMIKKFHKQNKELRFGTFIFGPVAMRLFYFLKKQDMMKEFLNDPELDGFFDQLKSYLLCFDLYFKNGMYTEILESFEKLQAKNIVDSKFPREALVLAVGACYKINTPETYKIATDLVTGAREARVDIIRKALLFVVALALNQNRADVALEILTSIDRLNNIAGNNLKLTAFAKLGRLDDAFDILRRATDQDAPLQNKIRGAICSSSLDALQKSVDESADKERSHIFEQLCRSLKESNSVTSQTIDDLVCMPIEPRIFFRDGPPTDNFSQFRQRNNRFEPFRSRDQRDRRMGDREEDSPIRRRSFAGLSDEY